MELCRRVLALLQDSPLGALDGQFEDRKADEQLAVYRVCILVTLCIYVCDAAISGVRGDQLVIRLCSVVQWFFMVFMYMLFSRRKRLLKFYDRTTSLIAVWHNTHVLLTPMVLDAISGAGGLEADKVETRTSTQIIRVLAAVMFCGFLAKVNTLHFVGVSLHALTWWIVCTSLQGHSAYEVIRPLLPLAFLLVSCTICVRKLQTLERKAFLEAVQVSATSEKCTEVQERLRVTGEACSRLLSAFCDAVFMTDVDFRVLKRQEHYCFMQKLNPIFGKHMDDENLLDHLYDASEHQKFNTSTSVTPFTGVISFSSRFRVSQQHSETDLLQTTVVVVPMECGRLVAIGGQALACSHALSEDKKTPVKAGSPFSSEALATTHEVMLPGSLMHTSVERSAEEEDCKFDACCLKLVKPRRNQLKSIGRPSKHLPQMKENESSQCCDDLFEDDNARTLAMSESIGKDAVVFTGTVSSTVVPDDDQDDLYDANGWLSQEGSSFTNNLSVDWGMTASSSTWKADRASDHSLEASATWQRDVSALHSELETEKLSKAVVRYVGLLTASSALVVADKRVAEARAEALRYQEVNKAVAAIDFNASHKTVTSVASSRKRSLQPLLSLSRTTRQGTGRHVTGTMSFRSDCVPSQSLGLCSGSRDSSKFGSWRGLARSMATHLSDKHETRDSLMPDMDEQYDSLGLSSFMMPRLHNNNVNVDEDAELEDLIMSESIRQQIGTSPDSQTALDSRSGHISGGSHMTGSETDAHGNMMVHSWVQTWTELLALETIASSSITSKAASKVARSDLDEEELNAITDSLESVIPGQPKKKPSE